MSLFGNSTPSSVVGLDIGTELIKVAEAKLSKDGIHITGLGVAPTPAGVVDNSLVVDPQALGAAIKQLLRDSGIRTKHVVSSISGQSSVVVRVIEVPKMTSGELAETMKWEVERHVPFSPTEIQMDFAPIEKPNTPPDAQSMEVLLAVAQQDTVNAHVQTIFAAGLEPIAIDVQPLAVSRPLIDVAVQAQPYIVGIVNIGATTTDVEVFEGGLLAFPGPPLPIAGINFTRAISEALGVPIEEAEMLKKEYAEVNMSVTGGDMGDGTAYDMGYAAPEPAPEPTSHDTSFQQAESDFSPFDFGDGGTPPPPPVEDENKLNISGDDVFDLGGGEESPEFKPAFDLEEPEMGVSAEGIAPTFDIDDDAGLQAAADEYAADEPIQSQDINYAPAVPPQNIGKQVNDAITPVLMELATEIRRSFDYYTTRYQNRPEVIFLCGGTARMRNLDQFLANELGIPVRIADPMENLNVQCPKYTPDYLRDVSPLFPVSIGLAIREMLE